MNVFSRNIFENLVLKRFRYRFNRSSKKSYYHKDIIGKTNKLKCWNKNTGRSKYSLHTVLLSIISAAAIGLDDEEKDDVLSPDRDDESKKDNEDDFEIDLDKIKSESLRTIVKYYQYLLEESIVSKENEYNQELEKVKGDIENKYFDMLQNTQDLEEVSRKEYLKNLYFLIDDTHKHQFEPNEMIGILEKFNSKLDYYRERDNYYKQLFKSFYAFWELYHRITYESTLPNDQIYKNFKESIENIPQMKEYTSSMDLDSTLIFDLREIKNEFFEKYNESTKYCIAGDSTSELSYHIKKYWRLITKMTSTLSENDINELNLQRLNHAKKYLESNKFIHCLNEIEKLEGKPREYMEPFYEKVKQTLTVNDYLSFLVTNFIQIFEQHSMDNNKKSKN